MKTTYQLPRSLAIGDRYARKDTRGIAHLMYFGDMHGHIECDGSGTSFHLVFNEDDCVLEYPTCLWCVAASRR